MLVRLASVATCWAAAAATLLAQGPPDAPRETVFGDSVGTTAEGPAPPANRRPLSLRAYLLGGGPPEERLPPAGFRASNANAAPPPVHRALFCRFDDDLDARRIPLRMRLGDLETVNRKEGKPGW